MVAKSSRLAQTHKRLFLHGEGSHNLRENRSQFGSQCSFRISAIHLLDPDQLMCSASSLVGKDVRRLHKEDGSQLGVENS